LNRSLGTVCVGLASLGVFVGGCAPPAGPPPQSPPPPTARAAALQDRPATPTTAAGRTIAASAAPAAPVTPSQADVVARVGTRAITKDDLLEPMVRAHGLSFLIQLVQLELARQNAAQQGVKVTPEDVTEERALTFKRMFKESDDALRAKMKEAEEKGDTGAVEKIKQDLGADREPLLDQYLAQQYAQSGQYVSRQEFELVLEINAHLRKLAEASPELAKALNEETLKKAFAARYGEKVVVRHIQAATPAGLQPARKRLDAGENFADVAKALSTNRNTAPVGGAIPPFTMTATNVPQIFKETAFSLKDGEVSDIVEADNAYHIIKVENRIAPKVVKYDDVKESLRADLQDQVLQAAVQQLRGKLSQQLMANLRIEHPVLKEQFDKKVEAGRLRQQELDEAMKRNRSVTVPREGDAPAAGTPLAPGATTQPASK
jgi:parvulin-like peptidyl-prolyl isomerase